MQDTITYKESGVNIEAGETLVERIKPFASRTMRPEVITGIGGFGAMFEIGKKYQQPILVSGTDGVGTKLKLAFELQRHDSVGIDLVAMSVNDVLVQGAEPLFFLDYFACGHLNINTATAVIKGIASGCEQSGCSLIGGETAEMPSMYPDGEYDLAGFAVGVVEKREIIDGSAVKVNDVILGLASSGFHSNGYSLIRKIINLSQLDLHSKYNDSQTWADVLMTPTKIYVKPILELLKHTKINAMAHITGGGISGNLTRNFPPQLAAEVNLGTIPKNPLFSWIKQAANLNDLQMLETFNCGIGFSIVVAKEDAQQVQLLMAKHQIEVYTIGKVISRQTKPISYI